MPDSGLGHLSADQIKRLLALQDAVCSFSQLGAHAAGSVRFKALVAKRRVPFQWSGLYELSYAEMNAFGLVTIGQAGIVSIAKEAGELRERLVSTAEDFEQVESRPRASQFLRGLAFSMAGYHSFRAIELYSKPINRLIAEGRAGNDDSFFKAVRVDPSCLSCPSLAKRVSLALMRGERPFLHRIHKAAQDGPNKGLRTYQKLRVATTLLEEAGAFEEASRERIFQVLVEELRLYDGSKGDPFKSLFRNIRMWRKDAAT